MRVAKWFAINDGPDLGRRKPIPLECRWQTGTISRSQERSKECEKSRNMREIETESRQPQAQQAFVDTSSGYVGETEQNRDRDRDRDRNDWQLTIRSSFWVFWLYFWIMIMILVKECECEMTCSQRPTEAAHWRIGEIEGGRGKREEGKRKRTRTRRDEQTNRKF